MDYMAMIENRKSVRGFKNKKIPPQAIDDIKKYFSAGAKRFDASIDTELAVFDDSAVESLAEAAGYGEYMEGVHYYLVLLSDAAENSGINAGFVMEDLVLKLTEMDFGTRWITFDDSPAVKSALKIDSDKEVAAIVAFGYPEKVRKRIQINIHTMSNIDITAKKQYYAPKKDIDELVYMNTYGNSYGADEYIGFYGDVLWDAFRAASLAPSYMNRQPYAFIIRDNRIYLIALSDETTDKIDAKLNLGIVMLHFEAAAEEYTGEAKNPWTVEKDAADLNLPEGAFQVASCSV